MEMVDIITIVISTIVALIGIGTLIKAIIEYRKNSNIKRYKKAWAMQHTRQRNTLLSVRMSGIAVLDSWI